MREYPLYPLVGVGAVIVRGREVLLVRRANPPLQGEWSLPGGLQKLGETVFQAACREVMEETGVSIRPLAVVDVVNLIMTDEHATRIRYHYTLIEVLAAWQTGELAAAGDATEAIWADINDVPRLVCWSETVRIVDRGYYMSLPPASDNT